MKKITFLLLISIFILSHCTTSEKTETKESETNKLGQLGFNFDGSETAMPHFEKGVLLMHNFEYNDAREAFLKAQKEDSTFVMAFWGEAMTYNHPLWREQEYENGQAALAKLGESAKERAGLANTELEKDFLQTTEILYGEGTKYERDSAYSAHLGRMYEKYPGNQEVAAFYALSILGAVPVGRDADAAEKCASIVKGISEENPNHPGALHYLIHSYDDPGHAHLALNAANSYSKVAADAAHALHMPSHIYVAVGMWNEVVSSNIASWNASEVRKAEKGLDNDALSYHALHWQMYGLLNLGKHEEARGLMQQMQGYMDELPSKVARRYYTGMLGNYLVETNDWDSDLAAHEFKTEDLNITHRTVNHFIEGMRAYLNNNSKKLTEIIAVVEKERDESSRQVSEGGLPMCSAGGSNRYIPNQADLDQSYVMELELKALRSWDKPEAENYLKEAAELESTINYSFGPPYIPKPSFELYGEWLIENDRPKEAAFQFEKALERGPKRMAGLKGKIQVAELTNNKELLKETSELMDEMLGKTG